METAKFRKELDDSNAHHEAAFAQSKKKHQEEVNELNETLDRVEKARSKYVDLRLQITDLVKVLNIQQLLFYLDSKRI